MASKSQDRLRHGLLRHGLLRHGARKAMLVCFAALTLNGCAGEASLPNGSMSQKSLYGNYLAGRYAGALRENSLASKYYARALEHDPYDDVILERAFLLRATSGNVGSAIGLAHAVVARDPAKQSARLVLAIDAMRRQQFEECRLQVSKAGPSPLTVIAGALINGWAYQGEGRTDEALEAISSIANFIDFDALHHYQRALINDLAGREEDARSAYEQALEVSNGENLRVVLAYARFLQRANQPPEALALLESFSEHSPGNPLIEAELGRLDRNETPKLFAQSAQEGLSEALYGLSTSLIRRQVLDPAAVYLRLALYLKEDLAVAQTLLGEIFEAVGKWEQAIDAYKLVAKNSPLYANAQVQVAVNLDRLDREDQAVSRLRRLIDRGDGGSDAVISLADVLRGRSRFEEAAKEYTRAFTMVEEISERHWSLYYARGISYERSERWALAEKDFKRALELSPDQPFVLNYLGYSWIDQHTNLEEALGLIRRAVELRPDDGYIVDSLGWAHYRLGDYADATRYLERAVEYRPEDPVINDHLGDAYWQVGRKLEARFQWRHALALDPEPEDIVKIKAKLDGGLPKATPVNAVQAETAQQ